VLARRGQALTIKAYFESVIPQFRYAGVEDFRLAFVASNEHSH
jgi:hypothetical protein